MTASTAPASARFLIIDAMLTHASLDVSQIAVYVPYPLQTVLTTHHHLSLVALTSDSLHHLFFLYQNLHISSRIPPLSLHQSKSPNLHFTHTHIH